MKRLALVLLLEVAACGPREERAAVPEGPFGLGRAPTTEELASWNISVNPTGKNLPPGQGTVAEGKVVYAEQCAVCHGASGEGNHPLYPKLIGREPADFSFDDDHKKVHTIGNYWPYATTLYDYINRAMPLTAPGSMTPPEIYAVVAYLLAANGVIPEDAIMNAATLPQVRMPARDRFMADDRSGGAGFR
jgi:cytochrome c